MKWLTALIIAALLLSTALSMVTGTRSAFSRTVTSSFTVTAADNFP